MVVVVVPRVGKCKDWSGVRCIMRRVALKGGRVLCMSPEHDVRRNILCPASFFSPGKSNP